jgi:hypothetical protein
MFGRTMLIVGVHLMVCHWLFIQSLACHPEARGNCLQCNRSLLRRDDKQWKAGEAVEKTMFGRMLLIIDIHPMI